MSKKSDDLTSDGFKRVANKTIAKGSNSWIDEQGRLHFKETIPTGSPEFVKKALSAVNTGEKTELEFAHNIQVYEKEYETPGTSGVIKQREIVVLQDNTLGDGDDSQSTIPSEPQQTTYIPTSTIVQPSPVPSSESIHTSELSPLNVLQNFVNKQADYLKWTMISVGVIAAATGILFGLVLSH